MKEEVGNFLFIHEPGLWSGDAKDAKSRINLFV